jgi:hypothetical protein
LVELGKIDKLGEIIKLGLIMGHTYKEWKDLEIFEIIEELADKIWSDVINWNNFYKFSIGIQLVKAIDSFGANIEEADGRYHFKEKN